MEIIIAFDLDGVIAAGTVEEVYSKEAGWAYEKCTPIPPTILVLKYLRDKKVKIVINTARWESDREKTEAWLEKFDVPYDELRLGKPYAHLYVDDRNFPSPFQWEEGESVRSKAMQILESAVRNRDATCCPL